MSPSRIIVVLGSAARPGRVQVSNSNSYHNSEPWPPLRTAEITASQPNLPVPNAPTVASQLDDDGHMEETAGAAGSSSSLPPEITMPPSQRGQKRGAPDVDDAAGDGAARGSPRRAGVDTLAEEEEEHYYMEFVDDELELGEADDGAPPARQLFEFLRVRPGAVDVTPRLGVGPVAGDYRGGTVDTTLSLGLGSEAAPGEDDGGRIRSQVKSAIGAALGAASNAEPDPDDGPVLDDMAAPLFHEPTSVDEEEGFAMDCFDATAGDGPAGSAADDGAAGRPSNGLDLNQPCPSELPEGAPPDPSNVPAQDTAVVGDDDDLERLEAHVGERGVATATAVEQRRLPSTPFVVFCGPAHA